MNLFRYLIFLLFLLLLTYFVEVQILSSVSASSVKGREISLDKSVNNSHTIETISKSENRSVIDVKLGWKSSSRLRQNSFHNEEIISTINKPIRSFSTVGIESVDELIDISSISTSLKYPGHDDLDLLTGIIGEYIVYEYLLNKYRYQSNFISIKWENEFEESHLPYDILLIENERKIYIEVKSTRKYNQHSFPLSFNQIESILKHTENYHIYRVYIDEKKLLILDKVQWRLKTKRNLSCFLTIESPSTYQTIFTDN